MATAKQKSNLAETGFNQAGASDRRAALRDAREEQPLNGEPVAVEIVKHSPMYEYLKRVMDLTLSALALIALSPLLICVAAAIKLTSSGPVFFSQQRVGLGGKTYRMFKFRTMVVNAEALKAALARQNEQSGPVFKMKKDPRVTSVGAFLRKHSIDELPQLWNVLKGEMSIVGPRPAVPSEVEKYRHWHTRRVSVKPGLTCIWQVSGRNNVSFEEWMRMDMRYIAKQSVWFDLKIIFLTFRVVIFGDGY